MVKPPSLRIGSKDKKSKAEQPDDDSGKRSRGDTRQNLLDAAMEVMAEDQSGLAGLSLRSVAKRAGVSPTAFYRHFPDMEELGLAMLDDIGQMLRRMLREVRKVGDPKQMVGGSMLTFFSFVEENRAKFVVLGRERVGGSPRMRAAIRNQMNFFSNELASDIQLMGIFPEMSHNDHLRLANLIINLAVGAVPDILDLPKQADGEHELRITMEKQALFILLGAVNWNTQEAAKDDKNRKRRK